MDLDDGFELPCNGQVSLEQVVGLSCLLCSSSGRVGFSLQSSDLRSQQTESSVFHMGPVRQGAGIYQPEFAVFWLTKTQFSGTPIILESISAWGWNAFRFVRWSGISGELIPCSSNPMVLMCPSCSLKLVIECSAVGWWLLRIARVDQKGWCSPLCLVYGWDPPGSEGVSRWSLCSFLHGELQRVGMQSHCCFPV